MNVAFTDPQFSSCTTTASTRPAHSGNFEHMRTTATDAEPEIPTTLPAPKPIRLRDRIIHPFKVALNNIGFSAVLSGVVGYVPSIAVFGGVAIASGLAGATVGCALGGLVKLGKMMAGSPSEANGKGLFLGGVIGAVLAIPPGLVTATALSLAAFGVIAPVVTILSIPRSIHQAITWNDAQMHDWELKTGKNWQAIENSLKRIPKGARESADTVKSRLS